MSNKLKNTIQWTLYILILLFVVLLLLIPMILNVFFPNLLIDSNLDKLIGNTNIAIGFLSAGLSLFSIIQANSGNKRVSQILQKVDFVATNQQILYSKMSEMGTSIAVGKKDTTTDEYWPKDKIYE